MKNQNCAFLKNKTLKQTPNQNLKQKGYVVGSVLIAMYSIILSTITLSYAKKWNDVSSSSTLLLADAYKLLKGNFIAPQYNKSQSAIRLGELPCPDTGKDGNLNIPQDFNGSKCRDYDGWIPWKRFSSLPLYDAKLSPLQYQISLGIEDTANSTKLNPKFDGELKINDIHVIAILSGKHMSGNEITQAISKKEWLTAVGVFAIAEFSRKVIQHHNEHSAYPDNLNNIKNISDSWAAKNNWLDELNYSHTKDTARLTLDSVNVIFENGEIVEWIM